MKLRLLASFAMACAIAFLPSAIFAGDLNPPGAPAPTMVPLDQINATASSAATAAASAESAANAAASSASTAATNAATAATAASGAQTAANSAATAASGAQTAANAASTAASGAQTAANSAATAATGAQTAATAASTAASGAQTAATSAATAASAAQSAASGAATAATGAEAAANNASTAATAASTAAAGAQTAATSAAAIAAAAEAAALGAQTAASDAYNRAVSAESAAQAAEAAAITAATNANDARLEAIKAQDGRVPVDTLPGAANAIHVISAPGSYYLRANVQGISGSSGILIASSNVSLDLNGFHVVGVPGSSIGIAFGGASDLANLDIRNGVVRGWSNEGIGAVGAIRAVSSRFTDLTASACGTGFNDARRSSFHRCASVGNSGRGFFFFDTSELVDCVARSNGFTGFEGDGLFTRCRSHLNGSHGFDSGGRTALTDCMSEENGGTGFRLVGTSTRATGCTASLNSLHGIEALNGGCEIIDCLVLFNGGGAGTQAGIFVSGDSTLVDGNQVSSNTGQGINASGAGTLVVRNTVRGSGVNNYVSGAGAIVAQRITPATNFVSTDPWANLSF
jgi:hypothetical protein